MKFFCVTFLVLLSLNTQNCIQSEKNNVFIELKSSLLSFYVPEEHQIETLAMGSDCDVCEPIIRKKISTFSADSLPVVFFLTYKERLKYSYKDEEKKKVNLILDELEASVGIDCSTYDKGCEFKKLIKSNVKNIPSVYVESNDQIFYYQYRDAGIIKFRFIKPLDEGVLATVIESIKYE